MTDSDADAVDLGETPETPGEPVIVAAEPAPKRSAALTAAKVVVSLTAFTAAVLGAWNVSVYTLLTPEQLKVTAADCIPALMLAGSLSVTIYAYRARGWPALFSMALSSVILAGAAVAVYGVAHLPEKKKAEPKAVKPLVNVIVSVVEALPRLPDTLDLPAVIEANRVVRISAEVSGRIEKIDCREGEPITAKSRILLLNTELLTAEFNRIKAKLDYDEDQYKRIEGLVKDGVATDKELDDAAVNVAVSKATIKEVEARLARTSIASPVAGIVNKLPVEVGEFVAPGTVVAEIVDVETVKAVVYIPERDIGWFKTGDAVTLGVVDRGEARRIEGTISYIDKLAHEATRSTRVEISIANADGALRSGQIIDTLLTRRILTDVVMVPLASVIPMEYAKAVYIEQGGVAIRREVTLGLIRGSKVRILSGLKPGDLLIVSGHQFVAPGQKVNVVGPKGEGGGT